MILLMEGMDKTGKTTVAEMLADDLGLAVCHFGVPPVDPEACYDYFRRGLRDAIAAYPKGFVLDRFHLSNQVYGPLLGGGILSQDAYAALDYHLAVGRVGIVLMVDKPHALQQRLQQDEQPVIRELTVAQVGQMQNEFNTLLETSRAPHKFTFAFRQFVDDEGRRTAGYHQFLSLLRRQREQNAFVDTMLNS